MRKSTGIQILVNGIILVAVWTGLMVMSDMGPTTADKLAAMHADVVAAKTVMVKDDLARQMAKFDHCTTPDKPFLTDHILIVGTKLGGFYSTGEVTEVTMPSALGAETGTTQVLAYCE